METLLCTVVVVECYESTLSGCCARVMNKSCDVQLSHMCVHVDAPACMCVRAWADTCMLMSVRINERSG